MGAFDRPLGSWVIPSIPQGWWKAGEGVQVSLSGVGTWPLVLPTLCIADAATKLNAFLLVPIITGTFNSSLPPQHRCKMQELIAEGHFPSLV